MDESRFRWPHPRRPCVVLGMAPAADGQTAWASGTKSGERLARLAGLSLALELPHYFALDNLLPIYMPTRLQLRQAGMLYQFLPDWLYVIAGSETLRALGRRARPKDASSWLDDPGVLTWYESRAGAMVAVLPHPSGRNRWYNRLEHQEAAEAFLQRARWDDGEPVHRRWRADRARNDRRRQEPRRSET